ncbi:hypothetical protein K503DRAFT_869953 [Rhizopogon vinicolor AM-OR11-026]|uniref:DUF6534 domain-containing protein n=1 Tax=Rhizopogon vinicolor AM-OR11-026 TaxID=1314800 RepID=A0A1B7MJN0_9AGAM|nr:hypothetical protein K503DRAFT_869953 [Rhizopogon vinicolor AM-OR11-026]
MLDALHLALITHCVYYYLVTNYANITVLAEIVWSFKLQIVIDVIIVYGVHVMYTCRIWIVSKGQSRVLPAVVGIIVILASGVALALIWAVYQCHLFSDFIGVEWATLMTLGTVAFIDFIIASSLCYILATSRTGFSRQSTKHEVLSTDSFLTKLMVYTINTGCLTSACSMITIITCAVMPTNFIFLGIEFLIAKLYINSYLALLNARYYLQPNAGTIKSSEHGVYHPELSQDGNFQTSPFRTNTFKHSNKDASHPTRPIQAVMSQRPIAVKMEKTSFSSV